MFGGNGTRHTREIVMLMRVLTGDVHLGHVAMVMTAGVLHNEVRLTFPLCYRQTYWERSLEDIQISFLSSHPGWLVLVSTGGSCLQQPYTMVFKE